ncbi:MAG TPA: PadR family transcriptional regulator [Candidatus Nanoarchaeia archaeon]|nr:PadR family transcriptional regulator [Candidatus Nanoarchaeia archaeon]
MVTGHLRPLVLLPLAHGERSGYQLMSHLAAELGHKPSPGSIYPLLKQLHNDGLVRIRSAGKSKYYALTEKGKWSVQSVTADHHGLLDRIRDTLHLYQAVAGKSITLDLTEMFSRIRQGKPPFGPLTGEMTKLRSLALRVTEKDLPAKQREEILRQMRKLNARLRRLT